MLMAWSVVAPAGESRLVPPNLQPPLVSDCFSTQLCQTHLHSVCGCQQPWHGAGTAAVAAAGVRARLAGGV